MTPQQPATDFTGLASSAQAAYSAVTNPEDATRSGDYQRTNEGLKKPFRLEWPRLAAVKMPRN